MHILTVVTLFLMAILPSCPTRAHDRTPEPPIESASIYQQYITNDGVAAAMAMSAIPMDIGIESLQFGIAGGWYTDAQGKDQAGYAVGIGKRLCLTESSCGIGNIRGAYNEGGGKGVSAGFTWTVK